MGGQSSLSSLSISLPETAWRHSSYQPCIQACQLPPVQITVCAVSRVDELHDTIAFKSLNLQGGFKGI
jgi:hypothetical protein